MKKTNSSSKCSSSNNFKINEKFKLSNKLEKLGQTIPSIFEYLKDIPDYRNINNYSNNTTYSIPQLVILCIIGCLQGQPTQIGFTRSCKSNEAELLKLLKLNTLPSLSTFNRLSKSVSFEVVNAKLQSWLCNCITSLSLQETASKVSIDGKYLKGYHSKDEQGKPNHQTCEQNMLGSISMFCQELKIAINSNTLEGKKESETYKFRDLLDHPLAKLITGDSLHCNHQTLEQIDGLNKEYIIGLKGNCSKLKSSLDLNSTSSKPYSTTTDNTKKVLRNVEVFEVSQIMKNEKLESWSKCNIRTLIKVTKTREKTSQTQVNTYISNIDSKTYTADEFALSIRKHWSIENNLHWHKDMIFGEDKHILNTQNPTFFFLVIYSFTISVINFRNYIHKTKQSVLDTIKYNANRLDRTLAVLRLEVEV